MQFFQNLTPRKILGIAFIAILAIGLPLTLLALRSQQSVRSKAAGNASVKLEPATFTATVNQQFDVNVTIAAGTNKVEYVKIDFTYTDPLTEVTFVPSSTYVPIIGPTVNTAAKKISFEGANTSQTSATGNINLGVLHVKGTTTGTGQIAFANIQLFDNLGDILVLENNITGTYTIGNGGEQTSPTITAVPPPLPDCSSDINRPANCTCSLDSQCASKVCSITQQDNTNRTGTCTTGTTTTVTTSPSLTVSPTSLPTQIPTTTVAPGETGLKLSLKLPGIGKVSGDNASPVRVRRTAKVSVFDSTNTEVVHEKTGALDYNATTGRFEGSVGIGTNITTGSYTVKVRMDNTLIKRLPGIVAITAGKADNTTPQAGLISGDLDQDNSLGVQDYTNFLSCFHGAASCTGDSAIFADINDNGSANGDNDDMNILQYNYVNRQGD